MGAGDAVDEDEDEDRAGRSCGHPEEARPSPARRLGTQKVRWPCLEEEGRGSAGEDGWSSGVQQPTKDGGGGGSGMATGVCPLGRAPLGGVRG